jgi:hypothetical protein
VGGEEAATQFGVGLSRVRGYLEFESTRGMSGGGGKARWAEEKEW